MKSDLCAVGAEFRLYGEFVIGVPFGTGHINDTYAVTYDQGGTFNRYIFQRVNTRVFRNPEALMENFVRVTSHIAGKIRRERAADPRCRRRTLEVVPSRSGDPFWRDPEGNFWRCYVFVENARTYDVLETPELAFAAASAFGGFQADLADLKERLHETIPDFHNTPARLARLEEVVRLDPCGRLREVGPELEFILARRDDCSALLRLRDAGELRELVTHNDTKLNNVLLDRQTGRGVCVIDLDTVMPGLAAYDFGDSIRFGASTAAEDEPDLSRVQFSLPMFEAFTRGFLKEAGQTLTAREIELLPMGAKLMTLECGMRFLADYLNGDKYFRVHREGHNLDRARTQFKLVRCMEESWAQMADIVRHCAQ